MFRYTNLLFMKQQLSFFNLLMFWQNTSIKSKIIEILVKSVMETADFSKLFLAIFERTYDGLYICYFLWLQHVSIKSNDRRCNFLLPHLKKSPKKHNQIWVKCCMKASIRQALLQTFLLIVQFSKTYSKTPSMTFFMNGRICGFCVITFKNSIN